MITTEQIKELRDQTGVSVMQCKKALEEAGGDMEKALAILKTKSKAAASKKADRTLGAGIVQAYIHAGGTVGAMIELSCETDFVSRNEEFKNLAYNIALHVAAMKPQFISETDISADDKERTKALFAEEASKSGKPAEMQAKMVEGKLGSHFGERTLLTQAFVKDPETTVGELIEQAIQKFGEKIEVTRMACFAVGA
jgi:elongation factor Ts